MLECIYYCAFALWFLPVPMLSVRMWGYFSPVYVHCSSVSVPDGAGYYRLSWLDTKEWLLWATTEAILSGDFNLIYFFYLEKIMSGWWVNFDLMRFNCFFCFNFFWLTSVIIIFSRRYFEKIVNEIIYFYFHICCNLVP